MSETVTIPQLGIRIEQLNTEIHTLNQFYNSERTQDLKLFCSGWHEGKFFCHYVSILPGENRLKLFLADHIQDLIAARTDLEIEMENRFEKIS